MNIDKFNRILQTIVIFGISLDSYSTYNFWRQLNGQGELFSELVTFDPEMVNLIIQQVRIPIMATLLAFLFLEFIAYYYLLKLKNWSRKYIISISIFYLLGCLIEFSIIYFSYGALTTYILFKYKSQFFIKNK